jgi:hypothetical protein
VEFGYNNDYHHFRQLTSISSGVFVYIEIKEGLLNRENLCRQITDGMGPGS